MEIIIEKNRLYILALVAMCGEVSKKDILKAIPATPQNTYAEIRKLKNEKLLTEAKTDHGPVLRLAYPRGIELLKNIPVLKEQYDLMTGGDGKSNSGRFHNSGATLRKRIERGGLILTMNTLGIGVNNLCVKYVKKAGRKSELPETLFPTQKGENPPAPKGENSLLQKGENSPASKPENSPTQKGENLISVKDGKIGTTAVAEITYIMPEEVDIKNDTAEEMLRKGSYQKANYYTSNIIKRYRSGKESYNQTLSINPSRMQGAIVGPNHLIALYYQKGENLQISQKAEKSMRFHLERIYSAVYGESLARQQKKAAETGTAIIFTPEVNIIKGIIKKQNSNKVDITDIYTRVYVIRAGDSSELERLLIPSYEERVIESIYEEGEIERARKEGLQSRCDAVIEGALSIEAVSMNICKIKGSIKLLTLSDVRLEVFCRKSDVRMLEEIYEEYKEQVKITPIRNELA